MSAQQEAQRAETSHQAEELNKKYDTPSKRADRNNEFVLFCFVWLATLGLPVLASRTAARTFRRVGEAP